MAAASVRMVMTASASRASSAGVAAAAAPAAITRLHLSAERVHTVPSSPTWRGGGAMPAPFLPTPAMPICTGYAPPADFPLRRRSVAAAGGDHTGLRAREKDRAFAPRRSATLSLNAAAAAV